LSCPEPETGLAYIDYEQQEFGIAAALSGDPAMLAAYTSGDPYLAFAKQAGAIPATGTRETHGAIRELFKTCALGVQYGMGAETLAARIGRSRGDADHMLQLHQRTYSGCWRWSDSAVDFALLHNFIPTVFGWTLHVGPDVNPRSLRNFPMQANGAEILRLACCRATEAGLQICAPIHDAVLIEAPLDGLDAAVAQTQQVLTDASAVVLGGFRLRTDVKVYRHPERFDDPRGASMWEAVQAVLAELQNGHGGTAASPPAARSDTSVRPDGTPVSLSWDTNGHPSSLISSSGS
jgi:DNA polymerase I-like protein with 3'-5' exonuclease and polymerase domains